MALDADPYRTLGLPRGASLDEVKRAYRALAKVNHPDAAGEAALPRFLSIQAAYEQLIGGPATPGRGKRASATPRRPWGADPDRSDATQRAYGARARSSPPPAGGARPGTPGTPGTPGGTSARSRRKPPEPPPAPGASGQPPPGAKTRPPNKATFGSTSYDGADAGPFEPDWGGASWYGTTSGTYWTLNPKEYADPRKHGPEYQARARRAARVRGPVDPTASMAPDAAPELAPDPAREPGTQPASGAPAGPAGPAGPARPAGHAGPAGPTHTTTSWWDSTAGASDPGDPGSAAEPSSPDLGRAVADIAQAFTDDHFGGSRGRIARAAIAWLPIALALGWLFGELTGCGRFAATCDGAMDPVLPVLQVAALVALVLVPAVASVAAMAALTLLIAAVVAALILSATGAAGDGDPRRAALGAVLLIAWLCGLAVAIVRRARILRFPTSPVS